MSIGTDDTTLKTAFIALGQPTGTNVGFGTRATHISKGVDVEGTELGVRGRGPTGVVGEGQNLGVQGKGPTGVVGEGGAVGVFGESPRGIGVSAKGNLGVHADGYQLGVDAQGEQVGVRGAGSIGIDGHGRDSGVKGSGPRGVLGEGTAFGVFGTSNGGVGVRGTGKVGVQGAGMVGVVGTGSPGGSFRSGDKQPQLHLEPHAMARPGSVVRATPKEYKPDRSQLPSKGGLGDLWLSRHGDGPTQCILWICVAAPTGGTGAQWAQVLLGSPIAGTTPPSGHLEEEG